MVEPNPHKSCPEVGVAPDKRRVGLARPQVSTMCHTISRTASLRNS